MKKTSLIFFILVALPLFVQQKDKNNPNGYNIFYYDNAKIVVSESCVTVNPITTEKIIMKTDI